MLKLLFFVVAFPIAAQAHAMLEGASPPVGSTTVTPPAELALDFSEFVEPRFSKVAVTDALGANMNTGAIHTSADNAKHLLVPVQKLTAGIYTVAWHAVSVDTHKTQGTYHFTIAP